MLLFGVSKSAHQITIRSSGLQDYGYTGGETESLFNSGTIIYVRMIPGDSAEEK